ncbi:MAG: YraN family protein [Anaerolineales bacterium]|nr:YraN family protein [Anaerolineales bacterium]
MTNARQKLGRWGENVAATHLESKGYAIRARNWRCVHGEVDLIAQKQAADGLLIAFVEVKTRHGRGKGSPEEALTPRKAQKLLLCAQFFLAEHNINDVDWQIDLIAIELDANGKLERLEHLPSVVWS